MNKRPSNQKRRGPSLGLTVLLVVILVYFLFANHAPSLRSGIKISETGIALHGPEGSGETFFAFEDLNSIEAVTEFSYGEKIDGVDTADGCYGIWKNEELGEYTLCIDPSIHTYVIAKTDKETFVFNCEAEATTAQIPDSVKNFMEKQKTE